MIKTVAIIENPLAFMVEVYIKKKALQNEFSSTKVYMIVKDELPHKIFLTFDSDTLCAQFIEKYNQKLADATLTHKEIHEDNGHGAHTIESLSEIEKVVVTGPNRGIIDKTNLDAYHATPAGDVMMTGPAGLIKAITYKI